MSSTEAPDKSGWSASQYNETASFVYSAAYTSPVLELLSARPSERIIDFGCGSAEITLELEEIVGSSGYVVGVDSSESMIEKAKQNGLKNAFVADIQALSKIPGVSEEKFDAVFTNAALHWCKRDPEGVIKSARSLLKPGGRFVGEMGGWMNCTGVRSALHLVMKRRGYNSAELDPWFFPSPEEYSKLLQSQGFKVTHISLTPRFTLLAKGMMSWLQLFVRNSWLRDFDETEVNDILKEVEDICRIDCQDGDGNWANMYVRLRFVAVLQ
ncbi:methyltransferase type 11 [Moniliophthora roreri MCA 2997]|uniref:Methyltransferase type 11 n=2 Tax=Moniliophthora roreri TaxID=221103 RepID=V2YHT9_MONRO|nr:methyltransferase type 11 [Moniliophthora roreri MCA 2997]KAI3611067.1 methyltransferase type 11 [Moniliophthora roreri]